MRKGKRNSTKEKFYQKEILKASSMYFQVCDKLIYEMPSIVVYSTRFAPWITHFPNSKFRFYNFIGPVWDTSSSKPTGYGVKLLTDYLLNVKK